MANTFKLRKVRRASEADHTFLQLHLFRDRDATVCGWYLGPASLTPDGVAVPYLPRSKKTIASVAVVRAIEAAKSARTRLCIVDPDDLWEPAWQVQEGRRYGRGS